MLEKTFAVAMSGGVDSSVVAAFLKSKGLNIFGVTMEIHDGSTQAVEDARKVCQELQVPHYVFNLRKEFREKVISVFMEYYQNGQTPNPCAICNRDIKFGLLLDLAKQTGADFLATGHYAKLERKGQDIILKESENKAKDQSYFLSLVPKERFQSVIFPLQDIKNKEEVRKIAKNFGFHNSDKKDSQDICFIKKSYKELFQNVPQKRGNIIFDGTKIGEHSGLVNYTIGQRKGIGISHSEPLYVIKLDPAQNSVILGKKDDLAKKEFLVSNVNWLIEQDEVFDALVKVRSFCKKTQAKIKKLNNSKVSITLSESPGAPIAPGQICCLYTPDSSVIAAGVIH